MTELETALSKKFRNDTNSYRVFNQQDLLDSFSSISDTLSLALGGVAAISLLVGGIGIMNIMLVSVQSDKGDRHSQGDRREEKRYSDQFLIEAVALSGLGGMLGVGIGLGISQISSKSMHISKSFYPFQSSDWHSVSRSSSAWFLASSRRTRLRT